MPNFPSWYWIELRITVGEIALCAVTGLSAWLVSSVLAKHQTADRALKNLTNDLCRETLTMLAAVSESIDQIQHSAGTQGILGHDTFLKAQRLSNSIHSIEISAGEGTLAKMKELQRRISDAKSALEPLNTHLLESYVYKAPIDGAQARQIEGLIRAFRESVIRVQVALV